MELAFPNHPGFDQVITTWAELVNEVEAGTNNDGIAAEFVAMAKANATQMAEEASRRGADLLTDDALGAMVVLTQFVAECPMPEFIIDVIVRGMSAAFSELGRRVREMRLNGDIAIPDSPEGLAFGGGSYL